MKHLFIQSHLPTAVLVAALAFAAACRSEPEAPVPQSQSGVTRDVEQPTTVTGCLRAGDAANTYVLTTARTVDGTPPATYQLTGAANLDLQAHVGSRVEASGIVEQQSDIATRQPAQPAESARGTSGTPTVQTSTELSVRRMNVTTIKPVGGDCQM